MDSRLSPPAEGETLVRSGPPLEGIDRREIREGFPWDQYLGDPTKGRLGIACSGGGVRSASYNLGVLQVLRERGHLSQAKYLSVVSGGSYIGIAHAITISKTIDQRPEDLRPGDPQAPPLDERERFFFGGLAPWSRDSPEEQHLRNNTTYLAPGMPGKVWFATNLLYGLVRHLLPFAASLYAVAAITGFALARWIGPSIRGIEGTPSHTPVNFAPIGWLLAGCGLAAVLALMARQWFQTRRRPSARVLAALEGIVFLLLGALGVMAVLLIALPALLLWLHDRPLSLPRPTHLAAAYGLTTFTLLAALAAVANFLRKRTGKLLLPLLAVLIGPLVIAIPFVGISYWTAFRGFDVSSLQAWLLYVAIALLTAFGLLLDEVTPTAHLYYRERLAKAFVTFRKKAAPERYRAGEPSWSQPIYLSELKRAQTVEDAKLPELIICAAANLSRDVPPGRGAASFTFESDFCGSPVTGYVLTTNLEKEVTGAGLTLPAMMAISGAALAPSMGKMSRSWARMLMAMLNVRLGVWLPNPRRTGPLTPSEVRRAREGSPENFPAPAPRASLPRRPGFSYVFREALGLNTLELRHVYVTDGGHWDNLGLVELLRRGCTQILCFDAAGDDLTHFHTLSEAIALARSDLGVEINIDVSDLTATDGFSTSDHVKGTFIYPDGTTGDLIFAKAAITHRTPLDVQTYREVDRKFPTDPTSDQLFNDARFEAYRGLGRHAAIGAAEMLKLVRVPESPYVKEPATTSPSGSKGQP